MKLRFLVKINLISVLSHDALAGKPREQKKKEAEAKQTAKMRLTKGGKPETEVPAVQLPRSMCVCVCVIRLFSK